VLYHNTKKDTYSIRCPVDQSDAIRDYLLSLEIDFNELLMRTKEVVFMDISSDVGSTLSPETLRQL